MMFDQDLNEQANISAADLAIMVDELKATKLQLAASQADNLRLREFAEFAWRDVPMNEYAFKMCEEALATPPGDQSALREVIAQSIECASYDYVNVRNAARDIRSGEWTPEVLK